MAMMKYTKKEKKEIIDYIERAGLYELGLANIDSGFFKADVISFYKVQSETTKKYYYLVEYTASYGEYADYKTEEEKPTYTAVFYDKNNELKHFTFENEEDYELALEGKFDIPEK
ncbi:MAG: hypothetical protein QXP59_03980 [Saccharolobus sp.]